MCLAIQCVRPYTEHWESDPAFCIVVRVKLYSRCDRLPCIWNDAQCCGMLTAAVVSLRNVQCISLRFDSKRLQAKKEGGELPRQIQTTFHICGTTVSGTTTVKTYPIMPGHHESESGAHAMVESRRASRRFCDTYCVIYMQALPAAQLCPLPCFNIPRLRCVYTQFSIFSGLHTVCQSYVRAGLESWAVPAPKLQYSHQYMYACFFSRCCVLLCVSTYQLQPNTC